MKPNINALIIGISLILISLIFSGTYKYKFKDAENITVTGLAEKNFTSNLIVWKGDYSRKSPDLKSAYSLLKEDEAAVSAYLKGKGISDSEVLFSSVDITKDYAKTYDAHGIITGSKLEGYSLKQSISVKSTDIDKIEKVSREITELIQKGIEMNSMPPSYYYTNLSALKIDLLAKASADAKSRAETIAKNSGSQLGKIKQATMGVFQITGENDNESYAGGGTLNTTSRNKTASITIRIDYAVE
ncbi:MAG: SIMPL domain-containing protein [Mucilaginibacter sp.]|uniref:SIMPL domain-containing protein n=1 Tax=Mucilaginibacter sp. TaxID=1882438 RepID=UPI003267C0A4